MNRALRLEPVLPWNHAPARPGSAVIISPTASRSRPARFDEPRDLFVLPFFDVSLPALSNSKSVIARDVEEAQQAWREGHHGAAAEGDPWLISQNSSEARAGSCEIDIDPYFLAPASAYQGGVRVTDCEISEGGFDLTRP